MPPPSNTADIVADAVVVLEIPHVFRDLQAALECFRVDALKLGRRERSSDRFHWRVFVFCSTQDGNLGDGHRLKDVRGQTIKMIK